VSARIADPDRDTSMSQAIEAFHRKTYGQTVAILNRVLDRRSHDFAACDLLALAHANLGQYNQASYYCSKALEIDPCATSPHYLLAQLAENNGNVARAKVLLKRVVYLDPSAILAYLDLAELYRTEGDIGRSQKMERAAHALLSTRDDSEILDPYRKLSVGMLRQQLLDRASHAPGPQTRPPRDRRM